MSDAYIFGGQADISKDFQFHLSNQKDVFNPANQSATDVSEIQPIRRINNNDTRADKELVEIQANSFVVSQDTYKTLLENLHIARLLFQRARNITMNQLNVYKEEAIEHMQEIKRIIQEDLKNPEASSESMAQELIKVSTEVIRNQRALNRTEMEELLKNLDCLLNTLKSDVKEAKSLAESEYEEESEERSYADLMFDYSHWCLFVLYISVILIVGLTHFSPAFERYLF